MVTMKTVSSKRNEDGEGKGKEDGGQSTNRLIQEEKGQRRGSHRVWRVRQYSACTVVTLVSPGALFTYTKQ